MNFTINKPSLILMISLVLLFSGCSTKNKPTGKTEKPRTYPSEVISFMDEWSILCGDGRYITELENIDHKNFFYTEKEGTTNWVVYKTPNSGITSKTSSNTRSELGQKKRWKPRTGGNLTGTLKVKHVSTSGDARVAASYSVVVGQIHGEEGHKNEPLKIFYKKFPGHKKGSVFWNYEINTKGDDNSGRWDYSTAVWGHDMSVIGSTPTTAPTEPEDGIRLDEEFSYEINVYNGIMYLTFKSEGHPTRKFEKSLVKSDFSKKLDIPQQVQTLYSAIGRDGIERESAYADEIQNFKQGAYNQTNGKNPEDNIVWSTGAETYNGDIVKQYANGCYTEVWFKKATVGPGKQPSKQ